MDAREISYPVTADEITAKAEQLGVTVAELVDDPFKAQFGVSFDELMDKFNGSFSSL